MVATHELLDRIVELELLLERPVDQRKAGDLMRLLRWLVWRIENGPNGPGVEQPASRG